MSWRIRLPLLIVLLAVLAYVFVDLWRDVGLVRPAIAFAASVLILLVTLWLAGMRLRQSSKHKDDKSTLRL